jgi:hypothetical protein
MNSTKRILLPIPEDEQSPFVDCLLKFIDWQTLRIEHLENEIQKLKKKTGKPKLTPRDMRRKTNDGEGDGKRRKSRRHENIGTLKMNKERVVKPENIQQLLVKNIQQQLINMEHKNKRQFTRINIQWNAQIDFGSKRCYKRHVKDISLSGIYVKGHFDQHAGGICTIILNQSNVDSDLDIHAACSIIRVNDDGMALEFVSMKLNDFIHLQTALLYEADDPVILGTEFVNNIDLESENDLILCKAYSLNPYNRVV